MRFLTAGLLGVGVLISQVSTAGPPASSLQQIGAVQAAIDFCSRVDSGDSAQIEQAAKILLPDMTAARVAAARHSSEFEQAYKIIDSVLKGLAPSEGVRLCSAAAQEKRHEITHDRDPNKGRR